MNIKNIDYYTDLLSKGTGAVELLNAAVKKGDISTEMAADFAAVLSDETSKLTGSGASATETLSGLASESEESTRLKEMSALVAALDKSILGSDAVSDMLDTTAVAAELMSDSGSSEVIEALALGHLNGIALSDSEDLAKDEDENLQNTALASLGEDTDAETLADNLEAIIASLGAGV